MHRRRRPIALQPGHEPREIAPQNFGFRFRASLRGIAGIFLDFAFDLVRLFCHSQIVESAEILPVGEVDLGQRRDTQSEASLLSDFERLFGHRNRLGPLDQRKQVPSCADPEQAPGIVVEITIGIVVHTAKHANARHHADHFFVDILPIDLFLIGLDPQFRPQRQAGFFKPAHIQVENLRRDRGRHRHQ